MEPEIEDGIKRLLTALASPIETAVLGKGILRELYYQILVGPQGLVRISEERDSRFTKSRTVVSLIPGQHGVVDFRLPG